MSENSLMPKRIYSYDLIRIIAAIGVIMAHSVSVLVTDSPYGSADFTYANFFDTAGRASIALFLMLSGALMLDEEKIIPTKKFFVTAVRMLFLGVAWSGLYSFAINIVLPVINYKEPNISSFIETTVYGEFHLWYLYMLAGLYMITPFLRLFVKKENAKWVAGFIVLFFIMSSLPTFINTVANFFTAEKDHLIRFTNKLEFDYGNEYLCYYLLGWLVTATKITKKQRRILYALGVTGFIVTFLGIQFSLSETNRECVFYANKMINVAFYGVSLFVFLNRRFRNFEPKSHRKLLLNLSSLTFGVYLIHFFGLIFIRSFTDVIASGIVRSVIEFLFTVIFSFTATFIISKMPFFNRFIKT